MSARTGEPRCSFCGKTAPEDGCLISGPEAYICDLCVMEAADMVDVVEDEWEDKDWPQPDGSHYDRAFEVYAEALAPIQKMLKRRYRERTVRVIATSIAWCLDRKEVSLEEAGREALAMSVRAVHRTYYPEN